MRTFASRPARVLAIVACSLSPLVAALAQNPSTNSPQGEPASSKSDVAKKDAAPAKEAETVAHVDLVNRYRFIEQYTNDEAKVGPGKIGQYLVRVEETLKDSVDQQKGAPKQTEIRRSTVYSERPAAVAVTGAVSATIRNYVRFQVRPEEVAKTSGPKPLDGLTICYKPLVGEPPRIISLSEDRRLREREYEVAARQAFVPNLAGLLPNYPSRVGDTWRVSKLGAQALFGEASIRGDKLAAKFTELRKNAKNDVLIAVISITGRITNQFADTAINAELLFEFKLPEVASADPFKPTPPVSKSGRDESIIEARGAITELRFARSAVGALPGSEGRLKYRAGQELILERTLGVPEGAIPLRLFEIPPLTDVNSWLTYADPKGRFAFHHPQDLLPPEQFQLSALHSGDDTIILGKSRPDGIDLVRMEVFDEVQTPEVLRELMETEWRRTRQEVIPGVSRWLPERDWPGMRAYHIEASLKLPARGARGGRMHYDGYLLLFGKKMSVIVVSTTTKDAVATYREEIEQMLRSFRTIF